MKFILVLLISNILALNLNCSDAKSKEDCIPVMNGMYIYNLYLDMNVYGIIIIVFLNNVQH